MNIILIYLYLYQPVASGICSYNTCHIPAITSGVRSWVRTGGSPVRVVEVVVPAIVRPVLEPGHQHCQQQQRGTSVILLSKMTRLFEAIDTRTCGYKKLYLQICDHLSQTPGINELTLSCS